MGRPAPRRRAAATAAALGLALTGAIAACGAPGGDGPVPLEVWVHSGTPAELATVTAQVEAFNEAGAGRVSASLRMIAEGDYSDVLQASVVAGTLPDVIDVDGPNLASLDYQGVLADLGPLVPAATLDALLPSLISQGTIDGRLVGAGAFDSGLGLYGNRQLLDAAGVTYPEDLDDGWTAEEFTRALEVLAAHDPDGQVLDLKRNYGSGEWLTYGFSPLIWSAGGDLVDRQTGLADGVLDGPAAVGAVTTLAGWRRYVDPNAEDLAFTSGAVALSWVGHWAYPGYESALGADLVVLPLPDLGLGAKTSQGTWAWTVSATSQHPHEAGEFVAFVLSHDEVARTSAANGAVPGRTDVLEESALYGPGGALERFSNQLTRTCGSGEVTPDCVAVPRPLTPAYPAISANVARALAAVLDGGDPQEALTAAAVAIDADSRANDGYPSDT